MAITLQEANQYRSQAGLPPLTQLGVAPTSTNSSNIQRAQEFQKLVAASSAAEKSKKEAANANSPLGIATETAKGIGSTLISSEKGLGEEIAAGLGAKGAAQNTMEAASQQQKNLQVAAQKIQELKKLGIDTTSAEQHLKDINNQGVQGTNVKDVLPASEDKPLDVAFNIGGTAADIASAGTYGGAAKGMEAGKLAGGVSHVPSATSAIKNVGSEALAPIKKGVTAVKNDIQTSLKENAAISQKNLQAKSLKTAIDAVNPELKGKGLVAAYKNLVTGKTEEEFRGMVGRQGLKPTEDVVNLGTRLQDVLKSSNPLKNLKSLNGALAKTESELTTALRGDPSLVYESDKGTLLNKLEEAKTQAPREFAAIKESKGVYDNVVDYAKEVLNKVDGHIEDLRNARNLFDKQVRKEYPSVFKSGGIDVRTPAGNAIKMVRDMINEHLYETAPNGSEIKALIRREADIFRAADNIGPKAAKTHGTNAVERVTQHFKDHPIAYSLGAFFTGLEAKNLLKDTTGI